MSEPKPMFSKIRLWIGRRLVGLGFFIAPDSYWTAFEGEILSARLVADNEYK